MAPRYRFRGVEEDDLPLLESWLHLPHWRAWWDAPETALSSIRDSMDSISVEPLIVELGRQPIAFLQSYDPHLEDSHPYADQPLGTIGIDLSIGPAEFLGARHGSAILRQFTVELFADGAPRVVIDPHPDNARAIRAYAKAGFRLIDRRSSIYGEVLLMGLDNPDFVDEPDPFDASGNASNA